MSDDSLPGRPSPPRDLAGRLQRAWLGRGPLATSLLPLAALYAAVEAVRRNLYRRGWLRVLTLPVPVVVVGNLIVGGAGKTPTVLAVVALLRRSGFTPGIVSRGYGRRGGEVLEVTADAKVTEVGDEPLLLRRASGAAVFVGRDRVAAAQALLQHHPAVDVIVSDDGLQHLRLARSAQVLVFDERGVGNGWPLPAGPLREALPRQLPARSVVLYNALAATTPLPGSVVQRSLRRPVELADWLSGQRSGTAEFSSLQGRPLVAAAGLARPERFFAMLRSTGLSFTPLPLPDHWPYSTVPWPAATSDVIVTEKDAVKLDPGRLGSTRVWVAALDFAPAAEFESALLALLPPPTQRPPRGQPPGRPAGSPDTSNGLSRDDDDHGNSTS